MTPPELHRVTDPESLEYYDLVLDALKRYIREGQPFSLETDAEAGRTTILFSFDGEALSPYMQHLGASSEEASAK